MVLNCWRSSMQFFPASVLFDPVHLKCPFIVCPNALIIVTRCHKFRPPNLLNNVLKTRMSPIKTSEFVLPVMIWPKSAEVGIYFTQIAFKKKIFLLPPIMVNTRYYRIVSCYFNEARCLKVPSKARFTWTSMNADSIIKKICFLNHIYITLIHLC